MKRSSGLQHCLIYKAARATLINSLKSTHSHSQPHFLISIYFIRLYCRPVILYSFIMYTSVSKIFAFGLLVSVPLANALTIPSQSQDVARSVDFLEARHHTEAQIAVSFSNQRQVRVVLIPERRKRPKQPKALVTSSLRLAITLKRKS